MTTLTSKNKTAVLLCAIAFLNLSLFAIAGEMKNEESTTKQNRIEIKDFAFNPQTITVKSGEKVTWINRDEEPHTIVSVGKQFKKSTALDTDQEFTITVGAPGITNVDSGIVMSAPNLREWNDVPLRTLIERELGIPALVENDTNLAAVGEQWRGSATGIEDFIFIALGTGVGAGIFLRGRLHHGANWSAGEIGYAGVNGRQRPPLVFHEPGEMERSIGGLGIEAEWQRLLARERRANVSELAKLRATEIFDLAVDGDRLAGQVVQYAAQILADCIVDLALALDPEMVILGGGVGSHPELCRITAKLLGRNQFAKPQVRSSSLGTQAQLHGAISLSLSATEAQLLA